MTFLRSHRGRANAHRGFGVFALGLVLVLLAPAGCGHTGDAGACVTGQSTKCFGAGQCAGYQVCRSDGTYGECECGGADAGPKVFPRTGPLSGLLGASCGSISDCRFGLDCVTSDSKTIRGEGPGGGMCLSRCVVGHPELCASVDATAKCIVLDDLGTADTSDDLAYCLPGCKIGKQPDEADKCRARSDVVCTEYPAGAGAGYCRPACRSDIDCSPRFCDLGTGLCTDSAPSGDQIGSNCSSTSGHCAGGCIDQNPLSECSGVCSFGTQGCGQNGNPPLDYYCAISATSSSVTGDLGYCARLCDCDGDCKRADMVCQAQHDLIAKAGRQGVCVPKATTAGGTRTGIACN